ncbi:unnamed protein product, partial [Linum tenue]
MAGNPKRRKKKLEVRSHDMEEQIDRLSDLPDSIIDLILSFLNTKTVAQTSLLSRRWRCLWKAVPTLNFCRKCFRKKSSFIEHVNKFLSLRSDSVAVGSITWDLESGRDFCRNRDIEVFDRVMKCAAGADGGQLHHLSINLALAKFSDLAASIGACDYQESLKILKLKRLHLQCPALSSLGFKLLTTLELDSCSLWKSSYTSPSDPLANLPACLNFLKLLDCGALHRVIVSAPQLLDLEIKNYSGPGIEVSAPKLKSFRLCDNMLKLKYRPYKLDFPSLDHACIRVWCEYPCYENRVWEDASRAYMDLLRGLHNVESLNLRFDKVRRTNFRAYTDLLRGLHNVESLYLRFDKAFGTDLQARSNVLRASFFIDAFPSAQKLAAYRAVAQTPFPCDPSRTAIDLIQAQFIVVQQQQVLPPISGGVAGRVGAACGLPVGATFSNFSASLNGGSSRLFI